MRIPSSFMHPCPHAGGDWLCTLPVAYITRICPPVPVSPQLLVAPGGKLGLMWRYKSLDPLPKFGTTLKGHIPAPELPVGLVLALTATPPRVQRGSSVMPSSWTVKNPDHLGSFPGLATATASWKSFTSSVGRFSHGALARIK